LKMRDIYLISACRTAIGNYGMSLTEVSAVDLGTVVAKEAVARAGIDPAEINEVMFGCILSAGLGQNIARQVALNAGLPHGVLATSLNMVCGSGMKGIVEGARAIALGEAEVILAGGAESMSRAPYTVPSARFGARLFDATLYDTMVLDGLTDAFNNYHMGITAENIRDQWGITRAEQDEVALTSQRRALAAIAAGRFVEEIVPVPITINREVVEFKVDEFPRDTSMERLSKLRTVFKPDGVHVTAGNASGLSDGAAAVIIASGDTVKRLGLKPMARLVSWGQAGVAPEIMGIGPVPATKQALEKAGLTIADLDLVEANEAFAAQAIAVMRELELDPEKTNVNGGAIALGHPIGATGARIVVTLVYAMKRRQAKHGLATLCIGGGMGISTIWELVEE
jgi:acetyl-CoA C-acetyltransferase